MAGQDAQHVRLLTAEHTHRGEPCKVGDVLTVHPATAEALIASKKAEKVEGVLDKARKPKKRRSRSKTPSVAPSEYVDTDQRPVEEGPSPDDESTVNPGESD